MSAHSAHRTAEFRDQTEDKKHKALGGGGGVIICNVSHSIIFTNVFEVLVHGGNKSLSHASDTLSSILVPYLSQ